MNALLALPILLPLFGAALSIGAGRSRLAQRLIGVVTLSAVAVTSVLLLVRVDDQGPVAGHAGGWRAPVGITFVADRLAAMMLVVSVVVLLAVLVFAIGQPGAEDAHVGFHPVYLVLASGVSAAFLTPSARRRAASASRVAAIGSGGSRPASRCRRAWTASAESSARDCR